MQVGGKAFAELQLYFFELADKRAVFGCVSFSILRLHVINEVHEEGRGFPVRELELFVILAKITRERIKRLEEFCEGFIALGEGLLEFLDRGLDDFAEL